MTISGLTPKNAGFHKHKSANFPASTDPTYPEIPWVIAGLIVYLATYLFARKLSALPSLPRLPRCNFILWAVCQVLIITSPTRPIAWESEAIILNAPKSWRISSAAIVSLRIRDSAKDTSSGMAGSR